MAADRAGPYSLRRALVLAILAYHCETLKRWCYLCRAIDSAGATIDFLLSALRDADAAKQLFRKALSDRSHPEPRVINTDLAPIYGAAIADIKKEGILRRRCRHRPVQYLNNILEKDHRAIKRRVNAKSVPK